MSDDEAEYLQRIVPYSYEGGISKTEDDEKGGC